MNCERDQSVNVVLMTTPDFSASVTERYESIAFIRAAEIGR
jgi:hypothetical protein